MANTTSVTVQAIRTDPDTGEKSYIGDLTVNADGMLAVMAAAPEFEQFLTELTEELNAKAHVNVKAPPPDELDTDDAGRFARQVLRTAPDFFEALQQYVSYYYGIALEKTP